MSAISELARKYAPWSTSKCDTAVNCPKQFDLKFIQKIPEGTVHADNKVGVVGHSILEWRVKGKSDAEARKLALAKSPLTSTEYESLSTMEDPIEAFLKRFDAFCTRYGVKEVLTEQRWAMRADGKPTRFFSIKECKGIVFGASSRGEDDETSLEARRILASGPVVEDDPFFRGVVDLAAITDVNDIWVIDHKSGAVKNLKYKKKQLDIYAVLAYLNRPDIAGAKCGINALANPSPTQLQWLPYVTADQIKRALVPWLFQHIEMCAASLASFEARPAWSSDRPKFPCGWCAYQAGCAEYQELSRGA